MRIVLRRKLALLLFVFQQSVKRSEGFIRGRPFFVCTRSSRISALFIDILLMFIIMAVEAQKLPVASVRGVIVMVVVLVVDGELSKLPAFEFASAPSTDMWIHPESLLAIRFFA